jgi:hypothetical protein
MIRIYRNWRETNQTVGRRLNISRVRPNANLSDFAPLSYRGNLGNALLRSV